MIDAVILGYTRFSQMEQLRNDVCYAEIRGEASPMVCRDLLKLLPADANTKLCALNKSLLNLQANSQPIREIMLDFDDTVVTVIFSKSVKPLFRPNGFLRESGVTEVFSIKITLLTVKSMSSKQK